MRNETAKNAQFKRKSSSSPAGNRRRRLPQTENGLSEEEFDRRAWAAANRMVPNPDLMQSDRWKFK